MSSRIIEIMTDFGIIKKINKNVLLVLLSIKYVSINTHFLTFRHIRY